MRVHRSIEQRLIGLVTSLVLTGCGGVTSHPLATDDDAVDGAGESAVGEEVAPDTEPPDAEQPDAERPDTESTDAELLDAQSTPDDAPVVPADRIAQDGAPDAGETDASPSTCTHCPSQVCFPEGDAVQCAAPCPDGHCRTGTECRRTTLPDGGTSEPVCVPATGSLCRPCRSDTDCRPDWVATRDACVDGGAAGSFCGRDCGDDPTGCPDGYTCRTDRVGIPQCVPAEGECKCSSVDGFRTRCWRENDFGMCEGERWCTSEGLAPCNAREPAPESCNGQDDDCDGSTDENLASAECQKEAEGFVCRGQTACSGGDMVCLAPDPGPEACDGLDNDCDGTTDPENSSECSPYYADKDGDGYGGTQSKCLCGPVPSFVATPGDCDDLDPAINGEGIESCNGRDDDCNDATDDGFECTVASTGTEPCGRCGRKVRTCSAFCTWGAYGECQDEGPCGTGEQGDCADGCGKRACADQCQWGACTHSLDPFETGTDDFHLLGTYSENDYIQPVTTAWLHSAEDVDRYRVDGKESGVTTDWSMKFDTYLRGTSGWHEFCLFYDDNYDNDPEGHWCVDGTGDLHLSTGDVDSSPLKPGDVNSGFFSVTIRGDWSCTPYQLTFQFE